MQRKQNVPSRDFTHRLRKEKKSWCFRLSNHFLVASTHSTYSSCKRLFLFPNHHHHPNITAEFSFTLDTDITSPYPRIKH